MKPIKLPIINEFYSIRSGKFQYQTQGWIGPELFRARVYQEFYERVLKINHIIENGAKMTRGYL